MSSDTHNSFSAKFSFAAHQTGRYCIAFFISIVIFITSFKSRLQAYFNKPFVSEINPYQHQKILLIALYKHGTFRNDIKRLLRLCRDKGYYVVAVNNLKITDHPPNDVDCYIERHNFGRDFGSYKTGFLYLLQRGYLKHCPRLLMLNDSVFYESSRLETFLDQLMNSTTEVLGATENFEFYHHLGSFCISFDNRIINHASFIQYWRDYRCSDDRTKTITYGELKLSKRLKTIISQEDQFKALYDTLFVENALQTTPALPLLFKLKCQTNFHHIHHEDIWLTFCQRHYSTLNLSANLLPYFFPIHDIQTVESMLSSILTSQDPQLCLNIQTYVKSVILETFQLGSQIHNSALLLFHLGLPLLKLDAFYRSILSADEVLTLASSMSEEQPYEFKRLLFQRPKGKDTLFGFKRLMFNAGFL